MIAQRSLPPSPGHELAAFVGGPPASTGAAPNESAFAILERMHRLLRGRYPLALSLAAVGATVGLLFGWFARSPKYMSEGSIHVAPSLTSVLYQIGEKGTPANFTSYVRTQANLIQQPNVVDRVLRSPEWAALGRGTGPAARDQFLAALTVITEREEPEWIRVRFLDGDPRVAKLAVEQLIDSYTFIWGPTQDIFTPQMVETLKNNRRKIQEEIDKRRAQISRIAIEFGADLGQLQTTYTNDLFVLSRALDELGMRIKQAKAPARGGPDRPAADPEVLNAEIAKLDPAMLQKLQVRDLARAQLTRLEERGLTPGHLSRRNAQASLNAAERDITDYRTLWVRTHNGLIPGAVGLLGTITKDQLEQMEATYEFQKSVRDELQSKCSKIADAKLQIDALQMDIKNSQDELTQVEQRLRAIDVERPQVEAGVTGRIRIISRGEEPSHPYNDPRKKLGAMGFVLGGALPIGAFMLLGLMDRRYRFSDEARTGPGQVSLLGILPNLPHNINDPEQAAVAAHCVHQIRTMLQINGAVHSRKVFAVTSPTSGDGKTSLALSLGLSFAASGSRTLLMDFDMVGGGLTSAMQARSEVGLLDAIQHGRLNGHVRPTSFRGLWLVPAGESDAHEVSRLSPRLVRPILQQAREEYDVVIIDTGPILGSLEASLVAAEADGVILALGCGQQRFQVERAINHLAALGATLLGVVFNRAHAGDFRRAVSSASVRSVPVGGVAAPPTRRTMRALGPMASTVASQISGDVSDDR